MKFNLRKIKTLELHFFTSAGKLVFWNWNTGTFRKLTYLINYHNFAYFYLKECLQTKKIEAKFLNRNT